MAFPQPPPTADRLLALVDAMAGRPVVDAGGPGGGPVHHRHAETDQPRGAGPHPLLPGREADPGRRSERGGQRGGSRRPAPSPGCGGRRRSGTQAARRARRPGDRDGRDPGPGRLPHAHQGAHPRRRQALDQAADRALRHRGTLSLTGDERGTVSQQASSSGWAGPAPVAILSDYGYGAVEPGLLPPAARGAGTGGGAGLRQPLPARRVRRARRRDPQRRGGGGAARPDASTTTRSVWRRAGGGCSTGWGRASS